MPIQSWIIWLNLINQSLPRRQSSYLVIFLGFLYKDLALFAHNDVKFQIIPIAIIFKSY